MSNKYEKLFKTPLSLTICAKRNSGKSYLLRKIINEIGNRYDMIGIYTATGYLDNTWDEVRKKKNVVMDSEFEKGKIIELLDYIKAYVESGHKKKKVLLILDDLTDEFKLNKADALNQLAFKSRHYGIDYIFTTHRYMSLSPLIRQNSTTQLFFKPNNQKELKCICEDLETFDTTADDLQEMLSDLEQYQALLVDKTGCKDKYFNLKA